MQTTQSAEARTPDSQVRGKTNRRQHSVSSLGLSVFKIVFFIDMCRHLVSSHPTHTVAKIVQTRDEKSGKEKLQFLHTVVPYIDQRSRPPLTQTHDSAGQPSPRPGDTSTRVPPPHAQTLSTRVHVRRFCSSHVHWPLPRAPSTCAGGAAAAWQVEVRASATATAPRRHVLVRCVRREEPKAKSGIHSALPSSQAFAQGGGAT